MKLIQNECKISSRIITLITIHVSTTTIKDTLLNIRNIAKTTVPRSRKLRSHDYCNDIKIKSEIELGMAGYN